MVNRYKFDEKKGECKLVIVDGLGGGESRPLELIKSNSFQWHYKHFDADLLIEKLSNRIITATLKNVSKNTDKPLRGDAFECIDNWTDRDFGRAMWNDKVKGYTLLYGLPLIFRTINTNYDLNEPWNIQFNYHNHLILKDRDERKPHYWYYWDYTPELSTFIYETLKDNIKPQKGEIVAIPAELGESVKIWSDNKYMVNFFYCGFDEDNAGYDFYTETYENWLKKRHGIPPALIITFLPTYFKNYELDDWVGRPRKDGERKTEQKITGTSWFKKIWEVFGVNNVPIIVRCYDNWIHTNLYKNYPYFYKQINSITKLPTEIDGREVGGSNYLAFFNCPWLEKKTPYRFK